MNIDRTKVNMTQLRQNQNFRLLVEVMQAELQAKRDEYETTAPASEFLRGQVISLKELVDELLRPTTTK